MKVEIKSYYSSDIQDINHYFPDDPKNFGFNLRLLIGPKGEEGEESFDLFVCTPEFLAGMLQNEDVILGLHFLFVLEFNSEKIIHFLVKYVHSCSGKDWTEVANKISHIGRWEFDNYQND